MIGTLTPSAASRSRIGATAAAALASLTVMRTSSEPARASALICCAVPSMSAVSVFVIDWTTIGAVPPTVTRPTWTGMVLRRGWVMSLGGGLEQRRTLVRHLPAAVAPHEHDEEIGIDLAFGAVADGEGVDLAGQHRGVCVHRHAPDLGHERFELASAVAHRLEVLRLGRARGAHAAVLEVVGEKFFESRHVGTECCVESRLQRSARGSFVASRRGPVTTLGALGGEG